MSPERLWAAVKRIVDAADPEGLLAAGCPTDEYAAEIESLAELVTSGPVTPEAVAVTWEAWFGPSSELVRSGCAGALALPLDALRELLA